MGRGGYKIIDQEGMYFVSFGVVGWVDVFTRQDYRDIAITSLQHCQSEKGLVIYGWCIMSNHVHLIISAKENNVSDVLGDFKKFTSKQIIKAIAEHRARVAKNGCCPYLKQQELTTAGIQIINSGNRIISQR